MRFLVLGLALGNNFASRLEEDTKGVCIKFVADAQLERMANAVDDQNMPQRDLGMLECWVKNNKMTFPRDKLKILFGS